jgi:basic amino acid/polyamine antiporter, APA family
MKAAFDGNGDLLRQIGFFSATILVVSNMVGTGIFTTSGFIMAELGDPLILMLCWLCGGIFALCGALCYGELGAKFPHAGGEYVFLRESFGKTMGFLSGWISLIVGFSAPIAAAAIAFATYLFSAFGVTPGGVAPVILFGVQVANVSLTNLTAVAAIVLFSLLHYYSLLAGARIQNILTISNFVLVIGFIGAGFAFGNGSFSHFAASYGTRMFSAETFAVSLIFVSFAYSGWNAAAYLGGEITDPRKNIPLSLVVGTVLVTGLYLLLNAVYIYALPADQMKGVMDIGALSARFLFGENFSRFLSVAVALGILSAVSAMIMTGPRVYYAMAKDGIFFPRLARVNPEKHTPAPSIALQAAIACVMVITATFNTLLMYIGFTLSLFAMMTVIGMMRIRKTRPDLDSEYKTFGYPVTPLLFIAGNLWIVFYMVKSRPLNSLFGLATIAAGLLVYAYFAWKRKKRSGSVKENK